MLQALRRSSQALWTRCGLQKRAVHEHRWNRHKREDARIVHAQKKARKAAVKIAPWSTGIPNQNIDSNSSATSLERIDIQKHRSRNHAILEELFPEEAWRAELERAAQRETPRLDIGRRNHAPSGPVIRREVVFPTADKVRRAAEWQGEQTSVLVLRNASKSLVVEDFQRLIPRGKHLDTWTSELGNIVKGVYEPTLRTTVCMS